MSLVIKKLTKDSITELKELFDSTPILSDYDPFKTGTDLEFKWQFFSEDYKGSIYYMAYDDKELIGTLAALIIPMLTPEGKICFTIKPEDALINIKGLLKHRQRDIFKELLDKIESETTSKEIKFLWGFTEAVDAFNRLGFENCFKSLQGVYTVNPFRAYMHLKSLNPSNRLKQKLLILGLVTTSYLKSMTLGFHTKKVECKEIQFEGLNEEVLISFLPKKMYSLYLSKEFLNWRIKENPSELKYGFLQFRDRNDEIISYLIYSVKHGEAFFIEHFLFDERIDLNFRASIIKLAMKNLKKRNAVIIRAMVFDHNRVNREEIEVLDHSGFTFLSKGIPFILKSNHDDIKYQDIYLSKLNTQGTF